MHLFINTTTKHFNANLFKEKFNLHTVHNSLKLDKHIGKLKELDVPCTLVFYTVYSLQVYTVLSILVHRNNK